MAFAIVTHPWLLPVLTALIGTGGLTVGIYSFIDPVAAARTYGIPVMIKKISLFSVLVPGRPPHSPSDRTPASTDANATKDHLSTEHLSLIHSLGIRNLSIGLTILSLTAHWTFFLAAGIAPHAARIAMQRSLGIVISIGALVPVVDAWVCWRHSWEVKVTRKTKWGMELEQSKEQSTETKVEQAKVKGGAEEERKGLWTGHEAEWDAFDTSRKAGTLHALRSLIWVAGGLWCLLR